MCIICSNPKGLNSEQLNPKELYIRNCSIVTIIPATYTTGLRILSCINCPNITSVPYIEGLEILELDFTRVSEIPHIEGLIELHCHYSPIKSIPHIDSLQVLDCSNCKQITTIPFIKGLYELHCNKTSVTEIPCIIGLEILNCSYCRMLIKPIPFIHTLEELDCVDCPFLNEPWNDYLHDISPKLVMIQRWFRGNRKRKRIEIQTKVLLHTRNGLNNEWLPNVVNLIASYVSL